MPRTSRWNTRLISLFGPSSAVHIPLFGAPMAGMSGGTLAAETARAGALGSVAAGHMSSLDDVRREIAIFRERAPAGAPLCVGFIGHSSMGDPVRRGRAEEVMREFRPEAVQFFAPAVVRWDDDGGAKDNISMAQSYGCKVVAQVGTESDAREALEAGADCLVAQGTEAGGHGVRPEVGCGTLPLARRVVKLVREWEMEARSSGDGRDGEGGGKRRRRAAIPVLAAGGIVDGSGVAAALALGCDGAVLGTRLWASAEAMGSEAAKARLASPGTGPDGAVRTTAVDRIANTYLPTPWPEPFDSSGLLRNKTTERWQGREAELGRELEKGGGKASDMAAGYRKAGQEGDWDVAGVYAGKGVGEITSVEGAYDIVTRVNEETLEAMHSVQNLVVLTEE